MKKELVMNIKMKAVLATAGFVACLIVIALGLALAGRYVFPLLIGGFLVFAVYCAYRSILLHFEVDEKLGELSRKIVSERRKT